MTELKHYDLKRAVTSADFYGQLHALVSGHLLALKRAGKKPEIRVMWDDMAPFEAAPGPLLEIEPDYEALTVRLHGGGA